MNQNLTNNNLNRSAEFNIDIFSTQQTCAKSDVNSSSHSSVRSNNVITFGRIHPSFRHLRITPCCATRSGRTRFPNTRFASTTLNGILHFEDF